MLRRLKKSLPVVQRDLVILIPGGKEFFHHLVLTEQRLKGLPQPKLNNPLKNPNKLPNRELLSADSEVDQGDPNLAAQAEVP